MKTVFLLRHAKAEPAGSAPTDFERALAKRGHEDSLRVGRALKAMGEVPDAIVTSSARRARETAEGVAAAAGFKGSLKETRALYDTPGPSWLTVLATLPASADSALLVAHNPGIEELAAILAGAPPGFLTCPTAGLIAFEISATSWKGLGERGATMRCFLRPKLIEAIAD
jgi:phosphohistidine phosphatase